MWKESNESNNLKHRLIGNSNKSDQNLNKLCDNPTNKEYCIREERREDEHIEDRIPWRALCLALFLSVVGSALILFAILVLTGFIETVQSNEQLFTLIFLGLLTFVPGFYHLRIAFFAYYRIQGFTFDCIPDFD